MVKEEKALAISFSGNAKAEICRVFPQKRCCAVAQMYGILLFCNHFTAQGLRIVTENGEFAHMLPKLLKKAFGLTFDTVPDSDGSLKAVYQITDRHKIRQIMEAFGFAPDDTVSLHINLAAVEEDCCKNAFLRGAFLAGGSVTDPTKTYHMELATTHHSVAREGVALIQEMLGFSPKCAQRAGGQVMYLKSSEQISDMLTCLGAPVAAMGIMEARLEKELNNKVNRRCNCDDANTSKVVEAAQEQLVAIRTIQNRGLMESLPCKLKEAAEARLRNPEASLTELAAMMEPPITKPAMNQRMKKLVAMAKE